MGTIVGYFIIGVVIRTSYLVLMKKIDNPSNNNTFSYTSVCRKCKTHINPVLGNKRYKEYSCSCGNNWRLKWR